MKIDMIPKRSQLKFTGLVKPNKKSVANVIINNPTKETIKRCKVEMEQNIIQMGLTVLKKVKVIVKQKY